jgi:hypothetical protein
MKNILAMPTSICAIQAVNILSTVFAEIPSDMAERLSPLTTHKSLYHISKNFASALLSCDVQRTGFDSVNFEMSSITILSFVKQSDIAKLKAHREAEQIAKNKRKFDFIESHRKALKTMIKGLGKITSMECIVKICANVCCVITAFLTSGQAIPYLCFTASASRPSSSLRILTSSTGTWRSAKMFPSCRIFFQYTS